MKIKWKKLDKNDPVFKHRFIISPIKHYFKEKEKKGQKPLFFEPIAKPGDSRDKILKNLIQALIKNGWKIKNKN